MKYDKKRKAFMSILQEITDEEMFKWIYMGDTKTQYLISSRGYVVTTNLYGKTGKTAIIKDRKNYNGYHAVLLHVDGKTYPASIHRLVAMYFIPNPNNLPTVNHIDGNKDNNDVSNLEWMSSKDNSIHAANNGLLPTGEKSRFAKIKNRTAIDICNELSIGKLTFGEIAEKYNTTYGTVYDIYRRKCWKQISTLYDFSNYKKDGRYKTKTKKRSTTIEKVSM